MEWLEWLECKEKLDIVWTVTGFDNDDLKEYYVPNEDINQWLVLLLMSEYRYDGKGVNIDMMEKEWI